MPRSTITALLFLGLSGPLLAAALLPAPDGWQEADTLQAVRQSLLTSSASDFATHGPSPGQFRNVHLRYADKDDGVRVYMLCGQFLPAGEAAARWTPFQTIRTDPYEQWIGAMAEAACEHASPVPGVDGDLSQALRARLDAQPAASQESGLPPSIRDAEWQAHSQYYPHSPLCGADEVTLWSCEVGDRQYSLCSSREMTRGEGHMQYRAADAGTTVFNYPAGKQPPAGLFTYTAFPNGDASIGFVNNGYRYTVIDRLRGDSSIVVDAPDGTNSTVGCGGNQSLQVNYTLRLMYESGVWER